VEGLRVRGGAALDMRWKDGKIVALELHATGGGAMRLIPPTGQTIAAVITAAGKSISRGADGVIHLERDASYHVSFH
jgi:alpha-L-fucosidase 2